MNKKIIFICGNDELSKILYSYLQSNFIVLKVFKEVKRNRLTIIKKRIKRIGLKKTLGQILFLLIIRPFLRVISKKRIKELINNLNHPPKIIKDFAQIIDYDSNLANQINEFNADFILINGVSILPRLFLKNLKCKIINIHAGITPVYRGSHGAYWALVNNDKNQCGVTLHFVDAGIDTGKIIGQRLISITSKDNFITYPYLQISEGIKLLEEFPNVSNKLNNFSNESYLWHHPTLNEYLYYFFYNNIK